MERYSDYLPVIRIIISLLLLEIAQGVESSSIGGDITVNTNLTQNGSPYVVTQDLTVAGNAVLTIQPGVELHFHAGVALHVKGLLQLKGNPRKRIILRKIPTSRALNADDLNATAPVTGGIRLRDGKNHRAGRLEIFLRGG